MTGIRCILPQARFVQVGTDSWTSTAIMDASIRAAAFDWLAAQVAIHGDVLPRATLAKGFEFQGRRVPVIGPQGIFKPALMDIPISITTSPSGPYEDTIGSDDLLRYRYRGADPSHRDNVGVRTAMNYALPPGLLPWNRPGKVSGDVARVCGWRCP